MKRNWILALAILLVIFASLSHAAIRRVGLNQTYTTLTAAYTAAVNDDTLLISPGVYNETVTSAKRLTWLGAGYDEATINGRLILNAGSGGTRVEGMYVITGSYNVGAIDLGAAVDLISIKRCRLVNLTTSGSNWGMCIGRQAAPGGAVEIDACILEVATGSYGAACYSIGDNLTIRNSVLVRRSSTAHSGNTAIAGVPNQLMIENCVFVGWYYALSSTNDFPLTMRNNIFYDWTSGASWGTYPGGGAGWSYNASSTIAPPGTDGILLAGDPFVNYDETENYIYGSSNLHLAAGSPCIDAGDPAILDLDNSRSDMGIYGGPTPHVDGGAPNYPFAIDLTIPANMSAGQQLPIQATGRIGAGY